MKNKIFRILLLLSTIAWFSAPCVASNVRRDDIITQTGVAVQEISTTITEEKVNTEIEKEWFKGWTTNVANVREEPSEDSRIIKVWEECTPMRCYKYDDTWVAIEIIDDSQPVTAYIKSEYITENPIENEYRKLMLERVKAEDKREWYLKYRAFIEESKYEDKPETIYDYFSSQELDLLLRVVQAEIGDYSFEQKVNVTNVILNRVNHERFGESLSEVLIPSQFSTISNGRINNVKVCEDTILACEYAFQFPDTTNGALFFDSDGTLNYPKIYDDSAHNFYTLREEIYYEE